MAFTFSRALAVIPMVALAAPALAAELTPLAAVEMRGKGPTPMVLIPGTMCDWTVWQAFMDRNADKYTMYAVTLPGFGGSAAPKRDENDKGTPWIDNAVAAVQKMIAEKNLKSPVIVGHSLGGLVALRVGAAMGDKAGKIVTVDGPPVMPLGPGFQGAKRAEMIEQTLGSALRNLGEEQWNGQRKTMFQSMVTDSKRAAELGEMASKTTRDAAVEYYIELLKTDATPERPKMTAPTLAMAALDPTQTDDRRKGWTEQMAKAPKATVIFFEQTRHFIMDDRTTEFDAAIAGFVAGKEVTGYTAPAPAPAPTPKPAPAPTPAPEPAGPAQVKPAPHAP